MNLLYIHQTTNQYNSSDCASVHMPVFDQGSKLQNIALLSSTNLSPSDITFLRLMESSYYPNQI